MDNKPLTPKQEAFAQEYVRNGGDAAKAYRKVCDVRPETKDGTIWSSASKYTNHPKVIERVKELQEKAAERAIYTLEDHIKSLQELKQKASDDGKYAAAIKAEEVLGKALGFHKQKVEVTGKDGGPLQSVRVPSDLSDDELNAELAKYGIKS